MTTAMVLLLAPLALAAVLTATAPSAVHRHRGAQAGVVGGEGTPRPRHARPSRGGRARHPSAT